MAVFSIIIPVYNSWPTLGLLLNSIPQKRDDLEVIIVDDCSTAFLDLKNELKAAYPRYTWIKTEHNRGGGGARNEALKHATGEWVVFADSDDFFTGDFDKCLDTYKDADLDIVFFNIKALDFNKKEYCPRTSDVIKEALKEKPANIKYRLTQPWGKFIRRELITQNNIKFDETSINNDVMFSTLCDFYANTVAVDPSYLYVYQQHKNSTQGVKSVEKALVKHEVICRRNHFLRLNGIKPKEYRNFVNINISYVLTNGELKDKITMLKTIFKYDRPMAVATVLDTLCSLTTGKIKGMLWRATKRK